MKECDKRKSHTSRKLHVIYISSNNGRHPVTKKLSSNIYLVLMKPFSGRCKQEHSYNYKSFRTIPPLKIIHYLTDNCKKNRKIDKSLL
jgi:hypothetical protein